MRKVLLYIIVNFCLRQEESGVNGAYIVLAFVAALHMCATCQFKYERMCNLSLENKTKLN